MFYIREEGEPIRQGFNFYPWRSLSVGCQMLCGPLRIEMRYSKRTKKLHLGWWLRTYAQPTKEQLVYVPGQTEALKKLYEKQNKHWDKKFEDWEHDPEVEKRREWEQSERNRIRDALREATK